MCGESFQRRLQRSNECKVDLSTAIFLTIRNPIGFIDLPLASRNFAVAERMKVISH